MGLWRVVVVDVGCAGCGRFVACEHEYEYCIVMEFVVCCHAGVLFSLVCMED